MVATTHGQTLLNWVQKIPSSSSDTFSAPHFLSVSTMPCRRTVIRREQAIANAIRDIKTGIDYRTASARHKIPISTLHYRMTTPLKRRSRKTALCCKEEKMIVDMLIRYANRGIPLTQQHLCEAIILFVSRLTPSRRIMLPFKSSSPSPGYLRAFRRRHAKVLRFGKPLRQESKRFAAVNARSISTHFATVERLIEDNNIDEYRLFNLDEVGVTPGKDANGNISSRRLMPRRGVQDYRTVDFSYENRITIMPVVNAAGDAGPPLFVIKGKKINYRDVLSHGVVTTQTPANCIPRGAVLATRAENGGVDRVNFLSWSERFVRYTADLRTGARKVLLVYDAYRSHILLEVLQVFYDNDIIVYALPAHSSGKTQPLDTVLFSAFKGALNKAVNSCTGFNNETSLDIFDLCKLLRTAYEESFTRSNIQASFRRAGLWPLDPWRLLNKPRPENGNVDARILDVDELEKAYEEQRKEVRSKVLGSTAKILDCGYVDTTNGCVMTCDKVMEMVKHKKEKDTKKKLLEEKANIEKELRAEKRRLKQQAEVDRMRSAQNERRAAMAKKTTEEFMRNVRYLKERRAVAKMQALSKKQK